jgi:signal transduction histidine kinase
VLTDSLGKRICDAVSRFELQCHITVQDDGEGIPPEDLPHIFDRFYRGRRRRPGSTGLGLAIAKAIIEAHGSQIFIESTVGSGTIVIIVLALAGELY